MFKKTIPHEAPKVQAAIDGRIMFSNEKAESILLTLQPGESIPEHKNPFDVLFIGLKGTATLAGGEQSYSLLPFETLYVTSEEMRSMQNHSQTEVRVMVVKLL